jgi:hypothetical protein
LHLSQLFLVGSLFARPAAAPAPPDYIDVINAAKPAIPCTLTGPEPLRCNGYPNPELWAYRTHPDSAKKLAAWAKTRVFVKRKPGAFRKPTQSLQVAQINDVEKFWLRTLEGAPARRLPQVMFVASLSARMNQPPDDDYGAGKNKDGIPFFREFYIVIDGYTSDPAGDYVRNSYKAGTFSVYGIGTFQGDDGPEDRLVLVGTEHRKFRICAAMHSPTVRNEGAQFKSCDAATQLSDLLKVNAPLASALAGRSLYQAVAPIDRARIGVTSAEAPVREKALTEALDAFIQRHHLNAQVLRQPLLTMLLDESTDPAWMPCGVGCCTADDR